MDQLFTKSLKRFMYNTKEFSKNNFNSVQYSTRSDEVVIGMTEIKSIIRMSPKLSPTKNIRNNVLFCDSVETINLNNSIVHSENEQNSVNSEAKLVKVKILEKPIVNNVAVLNLNKKSDIVPEISKDCEQNVENLPVIKIKVRVFKDNLVENNEKFIERKPSLTEFENLKIPDETVHEIGETCIFDENKTRPLSPIPVFNPPPPPQSPQSPKSEEYQGVDNLIEFHERQVYNTRKSQSKTLPRMGTSSLINQSDSKTKLNDSEIISALVRDRFVVNMYESRSFRRSFVRKPSTYGKIYKSLERTIGLNLKNDLITKQLNTDIVSIKLSSPIKLDDQFVSLSSKTSIDKKTEEIKEKSKTLTGETNISTQIEKTDENSKTPTVEFNKSIQIEEMEKNYKEIDKSNQIVERDENHENMDDFQGMQTSEYGSSSLKNSSSSLDQELTFEDDLERTETDISSYNMEEFLKKALGDELSSLDNTIETEVQEKPISSEQIAVPQEESISTSNASDLISKINTFQSNIYRSFTKKLQHMTDTLKLPKHDKESVSTDFDSLFSNNEQVAALLRQAAVQYEALKQITKALTLCRNTKEFSVSTEQVEGERLLLLATYRRQAILDEIHRLEYEEEDFGPLTETGTVIISEIILPLKDIPEEQQPGRRENKWYLCIFSCGPQVFSTQPIPARMDNIVKFSEEITFTNLPPDFIINLEVYCLLQKRKSRNFSHESKYHINKDVKKSHCPSPKKFLSRDKSVQKLQKNSDCTTGIRASSFKSCGNLKLNVSDLSKSGPWDLRGKIPLFSVLSGSISLQLQSRVEIPVKHSGFLTIGSESGGYAVWNRRWCVLDGHMIRYWNYPTEEESSPLKELDLKYSVNSTIDLADRTYCARPRTLSLEIARKPKSEDFDSLMLSCMGSYTIEKHYFSADNVKDLNIWQLQLNTVIKALRTWNVGYLS